MTGTAHLDAERAFDRAARSRRRAAVARWLRRKPGGRLRVYRESCPGGAVAGGIREIPLDRIRGTLEPSRAQMFDGGFRPAPRARARWQRLWLAAHRGVALPPIAVVAVDGAYAISDGHHRVSVALSRGAFTIDAVVSAAH